MAKKTDSFYFENFIQCVDCSCKAAEILEETLSNFQKSDILKKMEIIHKVEHSGDMLKHDMMEKLLKAFITPIEREDIISLNQNIDDVTDAIEDVLLRIYINNVTYIRPEVLKMARLIVQCCELMKNMMVEFEDFKKSKKLKESIIEINRLEEEGDKLFIDSMRNLHTTCKDSLEVIAWREIFIYLEKCIDACEHTADVVESVVMKNS